MILLNLIMFLLDLIKEESEKIQWYRIYTFKFSDIFLIKNDFFIKMKFSSQGMGWQKGQQSQLLHWHQQRS